MIPYGKYGAILTILANFLVAGFFIFMVYTALKEILKK